MSDQVRHRRRGEELENALLDAAWEELATVGFASLTMESVAARAKTGVAVLYRRWSNKDELVLAAIDHYRRTHAVETPDTGTLRGDLLALLERLQRRPVVLHHGHHRRLRGPDPAVHDALARWASDELRSTNAQIEFLLRRALDDAGSATRPGSAPCASPACCCGGFIRLAPPSAPAFTARPSRFAPASAAALTWISG